MIIDDDDAKDDDDDVDNDDVDYFVNDDTEYDEAVNDNDDDVDVDDDDDYVVDDATDDDGDYDAVNDVNIIFLSCQGRGELSSGARVELTSVTRHDRDLTNYHESGQFYVKCSDRSMKA